MGNKQIGVRINARSESW